MTIDEAIEVLQIAQAEIEWNYPLDYQVAFEMAVQALKDRKGRSINFDKFVNHLTWEADLAKRDVERAIRTHNYYEAAERFSDQAVWEYLRESITSADKAELPSYVEVLD